MVSVCVDSVSGGGQGTYVCQQVIESACRGQLLGVTTSVIEANKVSLQNATTATRKTQGMTCSIAVLLALCDLSFLLTEHVATEGDSNRPCHFCFTITQHKTVDTAWAVSEVRSILSTAASLQFVHPYITSYKTVVNVPSQTRQIGHKTQLPGDASTLYMSITTKPNHVSKLMCNITSCVTILTNSGCDTSLDHSGRSPFSLCEDLNRLFETDVR